MRVVVCVKQVLDPDAVNAYALWGRLKIDPQGRWLEREGLSLLMNAYDEQAVEAALRLRDQGIESTITVMVVGDEGSRQMLRHAFAMGVDQVVLLNDPVFQAGDGLTIAYVLSQALRKLGGADLILCGRQASDDDQGVVGLALAEFLGIPSVTIARDLLVTSDQAVRVTRVLSEGEEIVEVAFPTLVTISNELGQPRFPTAKGMMEGRRKQPTIWSSRDLEIDPASLMNHGGHIQRVELFVPEVQGQCEFIRGETVQESAVLFAQRLRLDGLI